MPGGRPALFKTAEELQTKITEYFESCKYKVIREETEEDPGEVQQGDIVTITGIALYLGFESRQSFYDYEKHEEYSYIIKRARLTVECEYEKRLQSKTPTGSIFALKNMGWVDKQELDHTSLGEKIAFSGIQIIKPNDPDPEVRP